MRCSVQDILIPQNQARYSLAAFWSNLQKTLLFLAGAVLSTEELQKNPPKGITSKCLEFLCNASPGGIHNLLQWITSRTKPEKDNAILSYLKYEQKESAPFLGKLVHMRNIFTHPKTGNPESILKEAFNFATKPPMFFKREIIEIDDSGQVYWIENKNRIPLKPFVSFRKGQLNIFGGLTADIPARLIGMEPECQVLFKALWIKYRVADMALEGPTPEEFHHKAFMPSGLKIQEVPWWVESYLKKGKTLSVIISDKDVGTVIGAIEMLWPAAAVVTLSIEEDKHPMKLLADKSGLASPPMPNELRALATMEFPIVLILKAECDSRQFLKLVYWLEDLAGLGEAHHLKILVARKPERLKEDQEKLWDRLPDNINGIFSLPQGTKGEGLHEYVWSGSKHKRFRIF